MGFLTGALIGLGVGALFGGDGGSEQTAHRVPAEAPSPEETTTLGLIMEMWENPDGIDTTFDEAYYREKYPDVDEFWSPDHPGGLYDHYIMYGKDEGRFPNANAEAGLPGERGPVATAYDNFMDEMARAQEMYEALPGLIEQNLDPIVDAYNTQLEEFADRLDLNEQEFKTSLDQLKPQIERYTSEYRRELADIAAMPGVDISFGGQHITTRQPLEAMRTLSDISEKRFTGGMEGVGALGDIAGAKFDATTGTIGKLEGLAGSGYQAKLGAVMEMLAQEEALPGRLSSLAAGGLQANLDPAMQLFQALYSGRMGTPIAQAEYQPTFLERLLPIMGQVGAGWAAGGFQTPTTTT